MCRWIIKAAEAESAIQNQAKCGHLEAGLRWGWIPGRAHKGPACGGGVHGACCRTQVAKLWGSLRGSLGVAWAAGDGRCLQGNRNASLDRGGGVCLVDNETHLGCLQVSWAGWQYQVDLHTMWPEKPASRHHCEGVLITQLSSAHGVWSRKRAEMSHVGEIAMGERKEQEIQRQSHMESWKREEGQIAQSRNQRRRKSCNPRHETKVSLQEESCSCHGA